MYIKKHHTIEKIIGSRDARSMTRNNLRSDTCFLSMYEPKLVKDTLENVEQSKAIKEEIEQIEKNKTQNLVSPEDKSVIGTKWHKK